MSNPEIARRVIRPRPQRPHDARETAKQRKSREIDEAFEPRKSRAMFRDDPSDRYDPTKDYHPDDDDSEEEPTT